MEEKNYDFESVYSLLVEKFYFLREGFIKDELEDIIDYEVEPDELDDTTLIETFRNRIFGWMRNGDFEDEVEIWL